MVNLGDKKTMIYLISKKISKDLPPSFTRGEKKLMRNPMMLTQLVLEQKLQPSLVGSCERYARG